MHSFFYNKDPTSIIGYMDSYLMQKPPDCSFFTENGYEIHVHKEILCQTDLMCDIVKSSDCCKIEIIFSSLFKEELELMVEFLYKGQVSCSDHTAATQVISNLQELLGFPKDMNIITDQLYEDILTKVDIIEQDIDQLGAANNGRHCIKIGPKKKWKKKINFLVNM